MASIRRCVPSRIASGVVPPYVCCTFFSSAFLLIFEDDDDAFLLEGEAPNPLEVACIRVSLLFPVMMEQLRVVLLQEEGNHPDTPGYDGDKVTIIQAFQEE
jgi:hypothetical protein